MSTFASKKLIIFDLDGTLAPSKTPIQPEVAKLFLKLLEQKKVAVISGGWFPQFQMQLLSQLPADTKCFSNLFIMPTTGTRLYTWRGEWHQEYAEDLTKNEKEKIMDVFRFALKKSEVIMPAKTYGEQIEDRGSQITFSALGQKAPLDLKQTWDPDHLKRDKIAALMRQKLPEFSITIGGATSIDVTRRGINKAYGIRRLESYLNVTTDEIFFVGDALYPGGNDYPAKSTGVDCIQVSGPAETADLLRFWLESPRPSGTMTAENRKEVMTN